jgi:glycine betaine/choline ABC-type transport system substrate-binding protein
MSYWLLLLLAALACSCSPQSQSIIVGSKPFTESEIIGEITSQLLESQGLRVERKFYMGGAVCFNSLKSGNMDLYVEYTGTGLVNLLHEPAMCDPKKVYGRVKDEFQKRWGLIWASPLGFNNTYAIVMRRSDSQKLGLNSISDLKKAGRKFYCGFDFEFTDRPDGYKGLLRHYGTDFCSSISQLSPGLMYQALADGKVDLISGYATDGRILSLGLTALKDDLAFFPPYEAAALVSPHALKKDPEIMWKLSALAGRISDKEITQLNAEVDSQKHPVPETARKFLLLKGLIR